MACSFWLRAKMSIRLQGGRIGSIAPMCLSQLSHSFQHYFTVLFRNRTRKRSREIFSIEILVEEIQFTKKWKIKKKYKANRWGTHRHHSVDTSTETARYSPSPLNIRWCSGKTASFPTMQPDLRHPLRHHPIQWNSSAVPIGQSSHHASHRHEPAYSTGPFHGHYVDHLPFPICSPLCLM